MTTRRITIAALATMAAITPALAAASTPTVTAVKLHRGAHGGWVLVADADYTGHARTASGMPDALSHGVLTATLASGTRRITVADTALLGEGAGRGRRVHFHIPISRAKVRTLGSPHSVRARLALARTTGSSGTRSTAVEHGIPVPFQFHFHRLREPTTPAPAPPVGFQQAQDGVTALVCVRFLTSGYGSPRLWNATLTSSAYTINNGNVNGDASIGGYTTGIQSDGAFSDGSYYDVVVDGFAQLSTGPTLSGTIPASALSGPVSSSTGNAVLSLQPAVGGFPTTWSLAPLSPSQAASDC